MSLLRNIPANQQLTICSVLSVKLAKQPEFADKATELAKEATALVHWMQSEPPSEALDVMRTSFTESLRVVYIAMAGIALVATIASFWTRHHDLDQALETEQGLSELKRSSVHDFAIEEPARSKRRGV